MCCYIDNLELYRQQCYGLRNDDNTSLKGKIMNSSRLLFIGLLLASNANASGFGGKLSGIYEVIKPDCAPGILFAGDQGIRVEANSRELLIKDNVLPATTVYDFQVGEQKVFCMGDCYSLYESKYAEGGTEFDVQRMFADTVGAPQLVLAGTTTFKLSGDILEIDDNDNGQGQPGPLLTCQLRKTR